MARSFWPELESLRGLAALSVAGFHVFQSPVLIDNSAASFLARAAGEGLRWDTIDDFVLRAVFVGSPPVVMFFVLSGFVLITSLNERSAPLFQGATLFTMARIFRVYPGWFVAVCIFSAVYVATGRGLGIEDDLSLLELVRNISLASVSIDGVGWSLQTELVAIPVVLISFMLIRQRKIMWLVALLIVSIVSVNLLRFAGLKGGGYFYAFILGGLASFAINRKAVKILPFTLPVGISAYLAASILLARHENAQNIAVSFASAAIIVGLVASTGAFAETLRSNPALKFIGRISFSFYLLHPLTLLVLWNMPETLGQLVVSGVPASLVIVVLFVASVVATLPLATLSFYCVERPAIGFGRVCAKSLLNAIAWKRLDSQNSAI